MLQSAERQRPGCTPGSGVSPAVQKCPDLWGTLQPACWNAGVQWTSTAPSPCRSNSTKSSFLLLPWVASSSFPCPGCQTPQPRFVPGQHSDVPCPGDAGWAPIQPQDVTGTAPAHLLLGFSMRNLANSKQKNPKKLKTLLQTCSTL